MDNNTYKQIHEDLKDASKSYTLVEGILEVHKSEEGHYVIKNPEPYISFGMGDIESLSEDIIENELEDEGDWYEGLYEFSYLMSYIDSEEDEMGRTTAPGYYEILSEEHTLLSTFEQIKRGEKLDIILDMEINDIFDF